MLVFYCVDDNSKINLDAPQMMHYLLFNSQHVFSLIGRK